VSVSLLLLPVFFFQAEDGIRDSHVTGVQTCALPISLPGAVAWAGDRFGVFSSEPRHDPAPETCGSSCLQELYYAAFDPMTGAIEIGRASCRGSVWCTLGGLRAG